MKNWILLFLFFTLFTHCSIINPCDGIDCFSPPPPFYFEILDNETGENLYTNEILDPENISIIDENEIHMAYEFISEQERPMIEISSIGWKTGIHHYKLNLSKNIIINMDLDMSELNEDCCTFFKVNKFDISNYEHERNNSTGVIKIKI